MKSLETYKVETLSNNDSSEINGGVDPVTAAAAYITAVGTAAAAAFTATYTGFKEMAKNITNYFD